MRDPLFEPITINRLVVKNRICLPAMHLGMAVDFQVTDSCPAATAGQRFRCPPGRWRPALPMPCASTWAGHEARVPQIVTAVPRGRVQSVGVRICWTAVRDIRAMTAPAMKGMR
ncbi:MAG: hypothetical protein V2I40_05800 [Desulfobacteraceae bacterium]|jgi:hypothetical protein|nr:hypothetical protein [Desulfobacteraceae bacterium]